MTQFQHTLKALLEGRKTETSRIIRPGERLEDFYYDGPNQHVYAANDRLVWATDGWLLDKTYAIQPGRTIKSVGRYRVEAIWRQDVRTLIQAQVEAEGFYEKWDFLLTWTMMHDKTIYPAMFDAFEDCNDPGRHHPDFAPSFGAITRYTVDRPAERYQAWRMTIKVLWETVDWEASAVRALQIEKPAL